MAYRILSPTETHPKLILIGVVEDVVEVVQGRGQVGDLGEAAGASPAGSAVLPRVCQPGNRETNGGTVRNTAAPLPSSTEPLRWAGALQAAQQLPRVSRETRKELLLV